MRLPDLHLIGIFHTRHDQHHSHCAFTGKALRFPKMMRPFGYRVIEYSNEGSESLADEIVPMISRQRIDELNGARAATTMWGNTATIGGPHHTEFQRALIPAMLDRVKPGDVICHPFGHAHEIIVKMFPANAHVETGIGYDKTVDGTFKVYESYAWLHTHIERYKRPATNYEWVIPNYFDLDEWPVSKEHRGYLAFLGRICPEKGLATIVEIAKRVDVPVVIAGQGDASRWQHPNIIYKGPLTGMERAEFLGGAICSLMPTSFVEPFGGSGVEGCLVGTPLVSVDYGAFTETVVPGVTGYRCKTIPQWMEAIERCKTLPRSGVAKHARARYSLEAVGQRYDEAFRMIHGLYNGDDWYGKRTDD